MKNLINVRKENGKQLLSAKELYIGLGLNKSQWSRWYKANIIESDFFNENIDWVRVLHEVEGNETMDFAISIDFAKHIAMMARTEKSHVYRNYFIECEKQMKQLPELSKELQAIFAIDQRTVEIDNRVANLENTMTIDYGQQRELQNLAKSKAMQIVGGKDSPVYKDNKLRTKVFSNVWNDFKDYFEISSYRNTPRKDLQKAIDYIQKWQPQGKLLREIEVSNSQISI